MDRLRQEIAALMAAALLPVSAAAQTAGFIVRLGRDTIAVERFTRSADRLEGDLISRGQVPVVRYHYVATLRSDGTVARFELNNTRLFAGGTSSAGAHGVLTFAGDSVTGALTIGANTTPIHVAVPAGALPWLTEESFALYELYGRRARLRGDSPVRLRALGFDDAPFDITIAFAGTDAMTVGLENDVPARFKIDAGGNVLEADGRATTDKVTAERVQNLDVEALATAFAGHPIGVLSPPDSVRVTVGGARIAVDYSRPAMRGRKVFGDALVPWGKVWRTGANAATRFTTSADLVIGGQAVPAGTYTLFTLPTPGGWTLIVNRQTKAPCGDAASCASPRRANLWGTDYNADSDFVRVAMRVEAPAHPVEQFTIRVEPSGAGGVLILEWETTRASVAFAKR